MVSGTTYRDPPPGRPNTAPESILAAGESWLQDGVELSIDNPTFIPGCNGVFGFDMSISNLTATELLLDFQGDDVSLLDDYRRNYSGQDIWWEVGTRSDSCYTSTFDDLSIRALEPNARLTIAVRVASRDCSPSDFRLTFNGKGLIKYARWTISLPVSVSTSTSADTPINSLLTPGEIWTKNGLEIQLKSPTRLPGCDGLFGFELSVINASPNEYYLILSGKKF